MKTKSTVITLFCAAAATAIAFAGCGGYTPEEGTNYFKDGDVYRVFEQQGQAQEIKDFALTSFFIPVQSGKYSCEVSDQYMENSMFFDADSAMLINREGAEAIYAALGISGGKLNEDMDSCYITNLYTYNAKVSYSASLILTVDTAELPEYTVYGEVADVMKYTFTYADYSADDGTKTDEGTFSVYVSGESRIDTFAAYD